MEALPVPAHVTELLSCHGTRLKRLVVEAEWSGDLAQLCRSLPCLDSLR